MELLLQFMRKQQINDEMVYKTGAIKQECFIRDDVCMYLLKTHAFVVSTHRSKSIVLPVYYFVMRNGIKVICRENFYGWKLTVKLPYDRPYADILPKDLFSDGYDEGDQQAVEGYIEGFRDNWIYSGYNPYDIKQRNFSFGIYSDYKFYVAMYMLDHLYEAEDFTKEVKKLTKEYIIDTIKNLYDENGYNETEYDGQYKRKLMYGWEILWHTYHTLDNYEFKKEHNIEYEDIHGIEDNPEKFADNILKYPEVANAFVFEVSTYKSKI